MNSRFMYTRESRAFIFSMYQFYWDWDNSCFKCKGKYLPVFIKGGLNVQKAVNLYVASATHPGDVRWKVWFFFVYSVCTIVRDTSVGAVQVYTASGFNCVQLLSYSSLIRSGTECGVPQEMFPQFRLFGDESLSDQYLSALAKTKKVSSGAVFRAFL